VSLELKEAAEILANIATFLGIPTAIFAFVHERRKDRAAREIEAYTTVNQSYVDYLRICLEHPRLSIHSHFATWGQQLSDDEVRDAILFEILVSSCESAYFLYGSQENAFKRRQWDGWSQYLEEWCATEWFQTRWTNDISSCYDADFGAHVDALLKVAGAAEPIRQPTRGLGQVEAESPLAELPNDPLRPVIPQSRMAVGTSTSASTMSSLAPKEPTPRIGSPLG
jgi:hypothetical protein